MPMVHRALFAWALLTIAVQGMRMQSELSGEGEQSQLDGKERAAKVNPWQAVVALLLAVNPSDAFTFRPGGQRGLARHRHSQQGMDEGLSRGGMPEMIEPGSKVRVMRPESDWFEELGVVTRIAEGDRPDPVVVRFEKQSPSRTFATFALDDLEASPSGTADPAVKPKRTKDKGLLDLVFGTSKDKPVSKEPPPAKKEATSPFHEKYPLPDGYVMFTAPWCKFCTMAKNLLQSQGYTIIERDVTDASLKSDMMMRLPDVKTIPQIFLDNTHIGGWSDLQRMAIGPRGVIEETFTPPDGPPKPKKQGFV